MCNSIRGLPIPRPGDSSCGLAVKVIRKIPGWSGCSLIRIIGRDHAARQVAPKPLYSLFGKDNFPQTMERGGRYLPLTAIPARGTEEYEQPTADTDVRYRSVYVDLG